MSGGLPIFSEGLGAIPRIGSILVKPVSAACNLDCEYCFYLDRATDPYRSTPGRRMSEETLERLVDTWLFYSFPDSVFAFQGGEPMLAGPAFFEKLVAFQKRYGRGGQSVSTTMQTNGVLIDDRWCNLFKEYNWLIGVSIDGPEPLHDLYRRDRQGTGSWRKVMAAIERLKKHGVECNVLCVVSQANVSRAAETYRFFRSLGIEHIQYIPLSDFDSAGRPAAFTISPEAYGQFLCETFDLWWPERRKARIRFFDNVAESLAGQKPGSCTLHEGCDSYAVVEYNGDVYPCDFFVERPWRLGNIEVDSWPEIARGRRRREFAANKAIGHAECEICEYKAICRGGCPKDRRQARGRLDDLDYFCAAYKMLFRKAAEPLRKEVQRLTAVSPGVIGRRSGTS